MELKGIKIVYERSKKFKQSLNDKIISYPTILLFLPSKGNPDDLKKIREILKVKPVFTFFVTIP